MNWSCCRLEYDEGASLLKSLPRWLKMPFESGTNGFEDKLIVVLMLIFLGYRFTDFATGDICLLCYFLGMT